MNERLPQIYLARHGETAWSLSGQHTGLTDLPLTANGEVEAQRLGQHLAGIPFDRVLASPLQRALRTCEIAGFGSIAAIDADLVEWDYGEYEGLTTAEILTRRPDWDLFRDGCPKGESPIEAARRADRVVTRIRAAPDNVLVFSSGHFSRVLASRWLDWEITMGRRLLLDTASLSILGYDHNLNQPVIRLWNEMPNPRALSK